MSMLETRQRHNGGATAQKPATMRIAVAALARDFRAGGLATPELDGPA
ncbi:MAG: hypothetical protein HC850_13435, partial [Rhodomicrobium sp.]|nr:hypothetical protein [Rhodomicrobium sp.]